MSIETIAESASTSMSDKQMQKFLTEQGVGVFVLPYEDVPYAVPMSFGNDRESALHSLFLLFGSESKKETLSDRAEYARFLVYRAESMHDGWQGVSLTGRVDVAADGEWDALNDAMENAWHPDLFSAASPMRGIRGCRFNIDGWTGIQHGVIGE